MTYRGDNLSVTNIWPTIQGEGLNAGMPTTFVRLQGCPLRCVWCDSRETWSYEDGLGVGWMSAYEVQQQVQHFGNRHVCITGGEPLTQPKGLAELLVRLHNRGYYVEVETAGSHLPPASLPVSPDSWIVDLKLPGSGQERFHKLGWRRILTPRDQLVCVCVDLADFEYARDYLRKYPVTAQMFIHRAAPTLYWQGDVITLQELAELVPQIPGARLGVQLHKFIWGNDTKL